MATAEHARAAASRRVQLDKGLKVGSSRADLDDRGRGCLDGSRLQLGRHARLRRRRHRAQAPIVTVLAFVPMLFISRLQGDEQRRPGLRDDVHLDNPGVRSEVRVVGGWGIVAADILVMASLAQIAGQYVFLCSTPTVGTMPRAAGCLWSASPGSSP